MTQKRIALLFGAPIGAARRSPLGPRKSLRAHSAALIAALAIGAGALPGGAGAATTLGALQNDLTHQMQIAGAHSSAYVYDLTAKRALFSERSTALRPPASVEKLYTATTVLQRLGPTTRLSTRVLGTGQLSPTGVWEGDLYLRGGGDPTFGDSSFIQSHYGGVGASISMLVSQLIGVDGIHAVRGSIYGDESAFDSQRGEPSSNFAQDPFLEGTLSGLAFDRGASGAERVAHAPAAYAARKLWAMLKDDGVSIRGPSGAANAPAGAAQLAQVSSPTIAQLLGLMLPPSDNYFAETLLKDLGAAATGAGTTAAGSAVVAQTITALLGIHPHVVDGSGLSEADRTSVYQVADMLVALAPTPTGETLRASMAVAGRTGTLAKRMRRTTAAGRCQGKTGTLTGYSNLVGYCQAVNGHLLAFAFFNDAISTALAHLIQDHMTITLASANYTLAAPAHATRANRGLSPASTVRR